jgi:hypothetical protein
MTDKLIINLNLMFGRSGRSPRFLKHRPYTDGAADPLIPVHFQIVFCHWRPAAGRTATRPCPQHCQLGRLNARRRQPQARAARASGADPFPPKTEEGATQSPAPFRGIRSNSARSPCPRAWSREKFEIGKPGRQPFDSGRPCISAPCAIAAATSMATNPEVHFNVVSLRADKLASPF